MIDLYVNPDDETSAILEINDSLTAFKQQIEMLLFTKPGDILGEPEFGIDLESYIHEVTLNEYDLKQIINTQIKKFCPLAQNYNYNIDIFFATSETTNKDSALINIIIENNTVLGVIV